MIILIMWDMSETYSEPSDHWKLFFEIKFSKTSAWKWIKIRFMAYYDFTNRGSEGRDKMSFLDFWRMKSVLRLMLLLKDINICLMKLFCVSFTNGAENQKWYRFFIMITCHLWPTFSWHSFEDGFHRQCLSGVLQSFLANLLPRQSNHPEKS